MNFEKKINTPKVSVVIPTYNRAQDLRRCLDSLKAQDFDDFEVIVCDDGSTDDTSDVVDEYVSSLHVIYSYGENFGGPAKPRNRGVNLARAEYIAFLDSDDWWAPTKLTKSVEGLEAGADIVYHDLWDVRHEEQTQFNELVVSSEPIYPIFDNLLCSGLSIPNSSVVVRASYLHQIKGISEDKELIAVEDWDTWIRLSMITEKFVRIPEALGYYWNGGGNISEFSPKQIRRIEAIYNRHIPKLNEKNQKKARSFLAYRIGRIAQIQGDYLTARQYLLSACLGKIDMGYKLKAIGLLISLPFMFLFRSNVNS